MSPKAAKNKKIFISWSGDRTKAFAKKLKEVLENDIFSDHDLECFVSSEDIGTGTEWYKKLKSALRSCQIGIVCISKDNINAPWLNFEAGAMIHKKAMIPLLLNCSSDILKDTPLHGQQAVAFHQQDEFLKMIRFIDETMGFGINNLKRPTAKAHQKLTSDLDAIFKDLKDLRSFNLKYVYPHDIQTVKHRSVFISAPMSSISPEEYQELRNTVADIKKSLLDFGFSKIICPLLDNENQDEFDDSGAAVEENFRNMKHADSMLVIYPRQIPSSSLVEIGYGIALSKKMVVFYGDKIPYIVDGAATKIGHITVKHYDTYADIMKVIKSSKGKLFNDVAFPRSEGL